MRKTWQTRLVRSRAAISWLVWVWLGVACRSAPTQTHVVLEVSVADAIAQQITRLAVYDERGMAPMSPAGSVRFTRGESQRFVLVPAAGRSELEIRVVALRDADTVASVNLRSAYASGRGLYLKLDIDCTGKHDLGFRAASVASAVPAISACSDAAVPAAGGGGASVPGPGQTISSQQGSGGLDTAVGGAAGIVSGAGGHAGVPDAMVAASGGNSGERALAGAAAGGGGLGGAGQPAAGDPSTGGHGGAGEGGSGSGGQVATAGSAGAEAGRGGAGAGSAGSVGAAGNPARDCYGWRNVQNVSAAIESLTPPAFVAGSEQRETPQETIPQFICQGKPAALASKAVGKASRWGCYIPGADAATAYTLSSNFDLLISDNAHPCLIWKAFDGSSDPPSRLLLGEGQQATKVCRVFHSGTGEGRATTGPRIGQVRFEAGRWVCRYEFYFGEIRQTLVNQALEQVEVLDLGS